MQLRTCPLCNAKNLLPSEIMDGGGVNILCENEHYFHFQVGVLQYLAHTEESVKEERRNPSGDLMFHVEQDILLN